jgi:hypothetical protein
MYMDRYDLGSNPVGSNNVIKETGVFQTYSIAFLRFSNFHHEFSNFPIAFCNVFSKINLNTVSEGDLGQISALTLGCGAVEYYIILPLVAVF